MHEVLADHIVEVRLQAVSVIHAEIEHAAAHTLIAREAELGELETFEHFVTLLKTQAHEELV